MNSYNQLGGFNGNQSFESSAEVIELLTNESNCPL